MTEKVLCDKSDLVAIADSLRNITGSTETFTVGELKTAAVQVITSVTPTLQDKIAIPTIYKQVITPDGNYSGLSSVIIEAIPIIAQATPEITVSSTGLITASVTQPEGYVESETKAATLQLEFAEDYLY